MKPPSHSFIQISDVHLLPEGLLYDLIDPKENLESLLTRIDRSDFRPEALVFSGDLANWGELESYKLLRTIVEPIADAWGSEVVYIKGNHDVDAASFREGLFGGIPADEPVDREVWLGGLRIIALDSTEEGRHDGILRAEQLEWLAAVLKTPAPDGTILAMHHAPIPSPVRLLNHVGYREPELLADVIRGTDVRMILGGHCHYTSAGSLAGVPVWICPATVYESSVLSVSRTTAMTGGGFTRVDVFEESVVATAIPLVQPPGVLYDMLQSEALELMGLKDDDSWS